MGQVVGSALQKVYYIFLILFIHVFSCVFTSGADRVGTCRMHLEACHCSLCPPSQWLGRTKHYSHLRWVSFRLAENWQITQACPRLHMLRGFKDVKSKVQRGLMLSTFGIQRPTCMVAHETASAFWYYVLMILDGVHAQSFADDRFSTIYNAVLVFYMMLLWLSRRVGENAKLSVVATWEALSNGYVLSKLAAERFVHRAFGKGLKGAIFRPGMLWGSSKTGTPKTVCGVCRHEWGHVLFKWGWACLFCTANQAGML